MFDSLDRWQAARNSRTAASTTYYSNTVNNLFILRCQTVNESNTNTSAANISNCYLTHAFTHRNTHESIACPPNTDAKSIKNHSNKPTYWLLA